MKPKFLIAEGLVECGEGDEPGRSAATAANPLTQHPIDRWKEQ
jgi:hypothetical protein